MKIMEKMKKVVAVTLAFVLVLSSSSIPIAAGPDVSGYDVLFFEDSIVDFPTQLLEGQVWTGKSVIHQRATPEVARAAITLYAWGNTFWQEPIETTALAPALDNDFPLLEALDNLEAPQLNDALTNNDEDDEGDEVPDADDDNDETQGVDGAIENGETSGVDADVDSDDEDAEAAYDVAFVLNPAMANPSLAFAPFALQEFPPLDLAHPYLVITDTLGEFKLDLSTLQLSYDSSLTISWDPIDDLLGAQNPALDWDVNLHYLPEIIWRVHQDTFVGMETLGTKRNAPVSLTFEIYLDEASYQTNHIYSSGPAHSVRYYPNMENRAYWDMFQTVDNAFEAGAMNWNNGWGMRSGLILDTLLGYTITLDRNDAAPANQHYSASTYPANWAYAATVRVTGTNQLVGTFWYHLEWGDTATRYVTIRDLQADGYHVRYQLFVTGPGGNDTVAGGRTVVTDHLVKREYYPDNPDTPIRWDGNAIVGHMDAVAQIMLSEDFTFGSVRVHKQLASPVNNFDFYADWRVDDNTLFYVVMQDALTKEYLVFRQDDPENDPFNYEFVGFSLERGNATQIAFSVNNPAELNSVPTNEHIMGSLLGTDEPAHYVLHEILMFDSYGLIQISYSYDENVGFEVSEGQTTDVIVTNTYSHGIGILEVHKLLDGFPEEWAVNNDTVFYVRIWDVEAQNYLLFKQTPEPSDSLFPDSFWCVGNHYFGLTEPYDGPVMLEIPISVNNPIILSNLWTWGAYEVREVRRRDGVNFAQISQAWADWWAGIDRDPGMLRRPWYEHVPDVGGPTGGFARWEAYWESVPEITDILLFDEDESWEWGVEYSLNNGVEELRFFDTTVISLTNRYKYSAGTMFINKRFVPGSHLLCWGITNDSVFYAQVFNDPLQNGQRNQLLFQRIQIGGGPVSWRNIGYREFGTGEIVIYEERDEDIAFSDTVTFSVNTPAKLINLPTGAGHNYIVEEVFPGYSDHIITTVMYVTSSGEIEMPSTGISADTNHAINVNVHNFFPHGEGMVVINKVLAGSPEDWGIDERSDFYIRIRGYDPILGGDIGFMEFTDRGNNSYEWIDLFYGPTDTLEPDESYIPLDEPGESEPVIYLPISVEHSIVLTGVPNTMRLAVGASGDFEEFIKDENGILVPILEYDRFFDTTGNHLFSSVITETNRSVFEGGHGNPDDPGNLIVTVTNRWEHGIGTLIVNKQLGEYLPDDVTETTSFDIRVRDYTDSTWLLWIPDREGRPNHWWCVGNDVASLSEFLTPQEISTVTQLIPISYSAPATLLNMWTGRMYRVAEILTGDFEVTITQHPGIMWHDDILHAYVKNTWQEPGPVLYTVTYHGNDHDGGEPPVQVTYEAGVDVTVEHHGTLFKTDHIFMGWSTNPEYRTTVLPEHVFVVYDALFQPEHVFTMPPAHVDLYAIWEPGGYDDNGDDPITVTYHWNYDRTDDGIYFSEEIPWNSIPEPPADPVRPGYTFRGWWLGFDGDLLFEYEFDFELLMDTDLYAIWEPIEIDPTAPTLTKAANRMTAAVGDIIYYTITITNPTTSPLEDFVMADAIDTGLVAFSLAGVRINGVPVTMPDSATFVAGILHVYLAQLPPGNTTITFPVTVLEEAAGTTVRNSAVLKGPPGTDIGGDEERPIVGGPTDNVEVVIDPITPVDPPTYPPTNDYDRVDDDGPMYPGDRYVARPAEPVRAPYTPDTTINVAPVAPVAPIRNFIEPEFIIPFNQTHYQYLIGYETGEIRPHGNINRAEVASIFFRLISDDFRAQVWMQENPFTDVGPDRWYNNAISTMVNAGVFQGMPNGTFQPNRHITRAEFAGAVTRFLNAGQIASIYGMPDAFSDIDGHWARQQINTIGHLGWVTGIGDNNDFEPNRPITRAEVAALINRMLGRRLRVNGMMPGMKEWPDNMDPFAWYYLDIQEATNSNVYRMDEDGIHKYWTGLMPNRDWSLLEKPDSTPYSIKTVD